MALVFLIASCHDSPTAAGGAGSASGGLALSLNVSGPSRQEAPGTARAFDRVDRIRVAVFRSESAVYDTTFALATTDTVTDLRLPITLTPEMQQTPSFGVIVVLFHGEQQLFQGSGTAALQPGKTTPVTIELNAVAGNVVVPAALPTLTTPGDSLRLGGAVVFATGDTIPGLQLAWSTPDTSVVRVHESGFAIAVGEGAATLTGRYGSLSGSVALNVHFDINSVSIAPIMVLGLVPDSTVQLTATVRDARGNPLPRPVSWSVRDSTVATVDSTGLLLGRGPGNTTVTAASGGKSAEIPVAVQPRAVTRLTVTPRTAQVILNDSVTLTAQAFASNGSALAGRAVTWTSASGTIATVSASGVVRGRRAGTTQIRAAAESARDSARIDVVGPPSVDDSTTVDSVTVSSAVVRGRAAPGNGATVVAMRWGTSASALESLAPTIELGADTLEHALRFALSDLAAGTKYYYRIEATNAAGRDSTVVRSFTTAAAPVASLDVVPDSAQLAVGDSIALSAVARGAGGEVLTGRPVAWASSDTAVATVSGRGVVHARSVGGAFVRGTTSGIRDSTRIVVIAPPTLRNVTVTTPSSSVAQVSGFYNPGGAPTSVWTRWGTSNTALRDSSTNIGITDAGAELRFFIQLTGLAPATTYYYRVHAKNAAGADSTPVQSFATPDTAPPPPTALKAVPTGESIYLSWQASTRATSYRIERSTDGSPTWSTLATVGTDSLKYVNRWDGTGTHAYSFRVLACREVGCSPPTDTVQAPLDARLRASAAVVGREHSCALQPVSGEILCWGANEFEQISNSGGNAVSSPIHPQLGTKYVEISAGYNRTCGIHADGRTYCWGAWSNAPAADATPQLVPGGIAFRTISVGADHACGLTAAGAAYCWGSNHSYQLARPDSTFRTTTPVLVPGGLTFRAISAGADQTCGVTTANQAYCWGWNGNGQLGIDDSDALHTHVDAPFAVAGGHSFATISAGDQHTCGVTTDNRAFCWGSNDGGQLGTDGEVGASYVPLPVSGSHAFAGISAGSEYTCGVTTGGAAYCWGINETGNLGTGTNASSYTPTPVAGGHSFVSVTAKFGHSCGIEVDKQLYCWGWNSSYQVGDGTTDNHNAPVVVQFAVPIYLPGS